MRRLANSVGAPTVLALLAVANGVLLLGSLVLGAYGAGPGDVIQALLSGGAGPEGVGFIVFDLRLPRALVALLAGSGLGMAGALLQGVTRNPLAAPSILGLSQGAAAAAVAGLVFAPGLSTGAVSALAFAGSAVASLLLYLFAWRDGLAPARLILVGVGLAAIGAALTTLTVTLGELYRVERALVWLMGSVHGSGWTEVRALAPAVLVVGPLAWAGSRSLDVLGLGEDVAQELGSRVVRSRVVFLGAAVVLTGASVAAAGSVAFVGLMAPHLARRLVGPRMSVTLPATALMGALLVVAADMVARTVFAPTELPCGIVTAVLGAPFFLYLLLRRPA